MSLSHLNRPDACAPFVRDTVQWLERAVVGLNLCPFAKAVHVKGQVHYAVCMSSDATDVLQMLQDEIQALWALDADVRDTTLLLAPYALPDFLDFHALTQQAERLVRKMKLEGQIQVASFHPRFQFAGAEADDISNYTNRAPYPTLHILREASIDLAVAAFPEAEAIYEKNIQTLEALGVSGWQALDVGPHADVPAHGKIDP
jgi:uncharacterized protein